VIMNQVQSLGLFCRDIRAFCDSQMGNLKMLPHTLQDPAQVESAAVDFMFYSGYVTLAPSPPTAQNSLPLISTVS